MDKSILELSRRLPVLSLEKMALIRTTTILCNNPELLSLITNVHSFRPKKHYTSLGRYWTDIKAMANRLISRLELSSVHQKEIMAMVWPISYKIMLWKFRYANFRDSTFLRQFYWTDRGRIDNIRTMKSLVQNTSIPFKERFILACGMSLIAEMREMWTEMSDVDKMFFCRDDNQRIWPLFQFWAHAMEGSESAEHYMEGALMCAIENGFFEAIKCLFRISSAEKRKDMAIFCIEEFHEITIKKFYFEEDEIDIGFFIFSEMTEERQMTMFKTKSEFILSLLVYSSDDRYFLNLLEERIQSDPSIYVVAPIFIIYYNYHLELFQDNDYGSLFFKAWRKLPISMRRELKDIGIGEKIVISLIRDNFRSLLVDNVPLKNMPELVSFSKNTLVYKKSSLSRSPIGFHQGKWEFLHFIILEEVVTVTSLKEYKEFCFLELRNQIHNEEFCWNNILEFVQTIENISKKN